MGVVHRRVHGSEFAEWDGVPVDRYATEGDAAGCRRHVLIGPRDGAGHFRIRYFEVPPNAQTCFEHHLHDHGVFILEGRARVQLGNDIHELGPGDVVYVAQHEPHQFESIGDRPLGFLCVIPSKGWLERVAALADAP